MNTKEKIKISPWLMMLIAPIVSFYCVEWFTHNPWSIMTWDAQLLNILFYELIFLILLVCTGRLRPTLFLGTLFFLIVGLGNYFVIQFRSTPIVPWDIFSLRTAASVADNYTYEFSTSCIIVLFLFLLILIISYFCREQLPKLGALRRGGLLVLLLALLGGYITLLHQDAFISYMRLDNTLFTPYYMARKNGFTTAFLMDLKYLKVSVPSGYKAQEAENTLSSYEEDIEPDEAPNIIVIMNEAFSDPAVLGDFQTNEDYMPFIHSLMEGGENTVSGYLNVSVKGGNTANTEYEFLTGNTMRFLPGGSVPYQQYIFGEKPSMVSWLTELGYQTAAFHPYNSTGWNRDKVYEYFGFDEIFFNSAFHDPERIRKYISDKALYEKMIEIYENKDEDKPLFEFAVTMQNHSGYSGEFDNFTPDITVEGSQSQYLTNYLSLMKIADRSFEELTEYFKAQEENTVIVFFGDHQPNDVVIENVWKLNGTSSSTLTDEQSNLRYKVPFVIWANFDIQEASGLETSANYFGAQVLETAGLPLSDYQQYLLELSEDLPVISTQRLSNSQGQEMNSEEERQSEILKEYNRLQYYRMYDDTRDSGKE